jgi:hypothetical protein
VLFHRKKAHENRSILVLSFIALVTFAAFPLIRLSTLDIQGVVGVDMTTNSVFGREWFLQPEIAVLGGVLVGCFVLILSFHQKLRRELVYVSFSAALAFLGLYMSYYFVDLVQYYYIAFLSWQTVDIFLLFYLVVFVCSLLCFILLRLLSLCMRLSNITGWERKNRKFCNVLSSQ